MKRSRLLSTCFTFAILFVSTTINAATWTTINGRVLSQTGTPVCAMVLANGQYMYSCGGVGNYSLYVPLDSSGLITLQVFAAGFAPFRQVLTTGQAIGYNVYMDRDTSGRAFTITHNEYPSSRTGWVLVSGNIHSNGTPLCAMIIINGQSMFSCNQNLGRYSLEVPLDSSGNITLQAFVAGFQPYRTTFSGGTSSSRLNLLLGNWAFSYFIGSSPYTDRYSLYTSTIIDGIPVLTGEDEYGDMVLATSVDSLIPGSSALVGEFGLLDTGPLFDQLFTFDIIDSNSVSGVMIWLDPVTGDLDCYSCPWTFVGSRSSYSALTTRMVQPMSIDQLFREQAALSADAAAWEEGDLPAVDGDMLKQLYQRMQEFDKTE